VRRIARRLLLSHAGAVKSKRKSRREQERAQAKLVRDLERLAALEEGGGPERPIVVTSPAVVDIRAVAKPCPLCSGTLKLEQHTAEEVDGVRLRVAELICTHCGVRRRRYFRLAGPSVH